MCGILAIINKKGSVARGEDLIRSSSIIDYRGPDDEGFLTYSTGDKPKVWAGKATAESTLSYWRYDTLTPDNEFVVGFGHRRLSILDLSPAGHQPMLLPQASLAITFNGEVYNYLEIKAELEGLGHSFKTKSDTEVILHAWQQWGRGCLDKFNGMFAFVVLDHNKRKVYAVRDRFGVKPLYYYVSESSVVFASEIKQIRNFKGFRSNVNDELALTYLAIGAVDQTSGSFDKQINQVPGGHYAEIDLDNTSAGVTLKEWYRLKTQQWQGSWEDAVVNLKSLLSDAINLRLRSDVTVGSCLSGGLDSSSIVCLAAELLQAKPEFAGQETVTARYSDKRYDEWDFAEEVIRKTKANPHQIFPTFDDLQTELDKFLWHQDEPTGSTSQFSQWSVFKKTHEVGLKVMIDGQGADEQLAGYGGNDLPFYAGLMRGMKLRSLVDEMRSYNREKGGMPVGFLLGAAQLTLGRGFSSMLPARLRIASSGSPEWLKYEGSMSLYPSPAKSLQENLNRQVYSEPLPALLRYEDRNSMAWSVESRTPFMDYRLLEFTSGLPERYIYYRGTRKHILREAMKGVLPEKIEKRKDKMGFVTPEEQWVRKDKQWFSKRVSETMDQFPAYFNKDKAIAHLNDVAAGIKPFDFSVWRIVCLGKWYTLHK